MPISALVYPMAAMVALTATVLLILFRSRVRAVRLGQVSPEYFRLYRGEAEPESSVKASRHFINLFEAPTLFYVACLAAMATGDTGILAIVVAWLYVIARIVHAWVHLGSNRLQARIRIYFTSWFLLMVLWIQVVVHVAMAGS
jgi:hypothetical protein